MSAAALDEDTVTAVTRGETIGIAAGVTGVEATPMSLRNDDDADAGPPVTPPEIERVKTPKVAALPDSRDEAVTAAAGSRGVAACDVSGENGRIGTPLLPTTTELAETLRDNGHESGAVNEAVLQAN